MCINEIHDELACHADALTETAAAAIDSAGRSRLESLRSITENVEFGCAGRGGCLHHGHVRSNNSRTTPRILVPPPFQARPPPPSLDPSTKLLAAAQDDANAIKACLAEA